MAEEKKVPALPAQPKMYDMMIEAFKATESGPKGVSVPSLKTYIVEKYNVDPVRLRARLKKAIAKGLEEEMVTRPKGSDELGGSMTGRFKLNKAKLEKASKDKAKALKVKEKKVAMKEKTTTKTGKSPKALKTAKAKTKAISKTTKAGRSPKAKSPKKVVKRKSTEAKATKGKTPAKKNKSEKAAKPKVKKMPKTPSQKVAKAKAKGRRSVAK